MAKSKRKQSNIATGPPLTTTPILPPGVPVPSVRRTSQRKAAQPEPLPNINTNPNANSKIVDGPQALRASPDGSSSPGIEVPRKTPSLINGTTGNSDSSLSELSDFDSPKKQPPPAAKAKAAAKPKVEKKPAAKVKKEVGEEKTYVDPEADGEEGPEEEEEVQAALTRPPPVNSDYLPLPWKGRLGYACLCTYLRFSNPPVFSSRTCRIASILENRHPLKDPSVPQHATKNRPDREQPADVARGQAYVESIGLANAKDVVKMIRWNDKYGIKFMRLSSEMFPFASHDVYGYKLAPFASEVLAEAGKVAAELGHRLTTHPGQFTQLGSPRKEVIKASLRDLEYHAELLSLLKLPPQQNRDAVMILHMGGVFGDKEATLDRFRENYKGLPQGVKDRLVLENDDVCYSVHDLLPICKELNIPLVLDYHHHNIIFDADKIREGTKDVMDLYDEIKEMWTRKGITQKMHYSEPTPAAITGRQRRKHNPRVATLPPCSPDMDLMIEAKDKEQAVFELMRTFKLPGYERFNDIIPHVRRDDNKPQPTPKKKATPKKKKSAIKKEEEELEAAEEAMEEAFEAEQIVIPDEEVGMGGPDGRVYWPPGMEDWLRPVKRVVKKKDPAETKEKMTPAKKRKAAADAAEAMTNGVKDEPVETPAKKPKPTPKRTASTKKKMAKSVPSPSGSDDDASEALPDLSEEEKPAPKAKGKPARQSARAKKVDYAEDDGE
ncbi:MAG: UV-damage endonuclease [Candelaria pacifica]|nr:MAG: UV-damage endonuclease [Candelaria pacifica]